MEEELDRTVESLNYDEFIIELPNEIMCGYILAFLRVQQFDKLYRDIHEKFIKTNRTALQRKLLQTELKVTKQLKNHLNKLIGRISSGETRINLIFNSTHKEMIDEMITELFKITDSISFDEKIKRQVVNKLNQQLKTVNQQIFELENYQFATYKKEEILGSNFYMRFPKEIILYEKVNLSSTRYNSTILYEDDSQEKNKKDLLNLMAYIQGTPNFLTTQNRDYNNKLSKIYEEFDLLDLVSLSSKKFFRTPSSQFRSLEYVLDL
jgi:hypothetical protein